MLLYIGLNYTGWALSIGANGELVLEREGMSISDRRNFYRIQSDFAVTRLHALLNFYSRLQLLLGTTPRQYLRIPKGGLLLLPRHVFQFPLFV